MVLHSSHPALALTRLYQSLLIQLLPPLPEAGSPITLVQEYDAELDKLCKIAARNVGGLSEVFLYGHPVRGVALVELGKLLQVNVTGRPTLTDTGDIALPLGLERLVLAFEVLMKARDELAVGFGKGGGDVGVEVDNLIASIEREVMVWRHSSGRAGPTLLDITGTTKVEG
jgi:hypothetical protein